LYATKGTRGVADLKKNDGKKNQLPTMTPGLMQVPKTINEKRWIKSQERKIQLGIKANESIP
jgi:hypothetical protein